MRCLTFSLNGQMQWLFHVDFGFLIFFICYLGPCVNGKIEIGKLHSFVGDLDVKQATQLTSLCTKIFIVYFFWFVNSIY